MYDVNSKHAEDFINHGEILDTLRYAEENQNNIPLIESLIEKAACKKGLSHREASVLLACQDAEMNQKIFRLAEQIKKDFYGNRIVLFAPLYLSNYCGCTYCPYHLKNKHIPRKKLSQEDIRREVIALQDMGHKRLALEAGEDPVHNTMDYYLDSINTIYSIKHRNGAIRRVNINIAATTVDNYRLLKEAEVGTYILFQETYHKESYLTQPDQSMTMITTQRRWIGPWRAVLTTLVLAFCLDLTNTVMNLPDSSCTPSIWRPPSAWVLTRSACQDLEMPTILTQMHLQMVSTTILLQKSWHVSELRSHTPA